MLDTVLESGIVRKGKQMYTTLQEENETKLIISNAIFEENGKSRLLGCNMLSGVKTNSY